MYFIREKVKSFDWTMYLRISKKERISVAKGDSLDKIRKEVANYLRNLIFYVVNFESTKRFSRSYSFGRLSGRVICGMSDWAIESCEKR